MGQTVIALQLKIYDSINKKSASHRGADPELLAGTQMGFWEEPNICAFQNNFQYIAMPNANFCSATLHCTVNTLL